MLLTQSERQVKKVSQFTSNLAPTEVLQGIDAALQEMGCDTRWAWCEILGFSVRVF